MFPAVLIVPLVALLPAFAEEIGWRGYALPRTLTVMSALRAALVLGIPWALIHVPLYLPGQMNGGSAVWSMVTQIVSYSVILTWIYVGTGGSVLMTGLFHALLNGLTPLTNGLDPSWRGTSAASCSRSWRSSSSRSADSAASSHRCRPGADTAQTPASRNAAGPFAFR